MTQTTTRRTTARRLTAIVAVACALAVVVGTAAADARSGRRPWTRLSPAAQEARIAAVAPTKRAVVVVGPVGSSTARFIARGEAIAIAAEEEGMEVVRLYHPEATWERVVEAATGADLFVYLGHGNGWPSPYGPFQEETKNGLGLTPKLGTKDNVSTRYWGADHIRAEIRFAPNAIVLFSGLCYASGNAESGSPIPSLAVARERVDNYAAGFLDAGARTVIALGWQPGATFVHTLFGTDPVTMDGFFRMRFGRPVGPYNGWIGAKPSLDFPSVRVPGARVRLDPDPEAGYLRAISGDHELSNVEWLGVADPNDLDAPVLSDVSGVQDEDTIVSADEAAPVFTPNRDGLSEELPVRYVLSEPAFLSVRIRKVGGNDVRRFTFWAEAGAGSITWNGRNDDRKVVADGRYRIELSARDRSGNVSEPVALPVRVLTALAKPQVAGALFYNGDGDALAATSVQSATLLREATVTWRILDAAGSVVRTGLAESLLASGPVGWEWDGRDDAGAIVPDGRYTSLVTVSTDAGSYSHRLVIDHAAFLLGGPLALRPGRTATLDLVSAEPLTGRPTITVKQPGTPAYTVTAKRIDATTFRVTWSVPRGKAGKVTLTVAGTDADGGAQSAIFRGTIGAAG